MQERGRYHARIARSVTTSRSDRSHVRGWSGYRPKLSVKADILDGQPSASSGLEIDRRSLEVSEAEAQSGRCGDVVALKVAVGQSAIHLRGHDAEVEIPFRRKQPINDTRDRAERTGALRMLAAGAGRGPPGGRPEVGILGVVVIAGDHIQFVGNGVLRTTPHDLQNLVAATVDAKGRIPNVRVVDRGTSLAKKGSRDVCKSDLRIAGRRKLNSFVTAVQFQPSDAVSGEQHHAAIVGNSRPERLRQERWYWDPIGVIASWP
jgi:hypothetical protein